MALEKAFIQPLNEKGRNLGDRIVVMFNPEQYTIDQKVAFQRTNLPGLQTPITQFVHGEAQTLRLDLFFDTYEQGTDVRNLTKKLTRLIDINSEMHAPPLCKFVWGKLEFKAVIDNINQTYTMFLDSGIPVRAKLTVNFTEYRTITEQLEKIPRNSADRTKYYVVTQADSLWSLAERFYDEPDKWRVIAKANKIDNPRILTPGMELTIPAL